jgi:hypothetical protein
MVTGYPVYSFSLVTLLKLLHIKQDTGNSPYPGSICRELKRMLFILGPSEVDVYRNYVAAVYSFLPPSLYGQQHALEEQSTLFVACLSEA